MKTYGEIKAIMENHYRVIPFKSILVTERALSVLKQTNSMELLDVVDSNYPKMKLTESSVFRLSLDVDIHLCSYRLTYWRSGGKTILVKRGRIFTNYPNGRYFFTISFLNNRPIFMCPSEYPKILEGELMMKYLVTHNYHEYHSSGIVEASSEDEAIKIFITKLLNYCKNNNEDGSCYLFCCPDIEDYDSIEELVANYEYPIQAIPLNYDTGLMVYDRSHSKLEMIPID